MRRLAAIPVALLAFLLLLLHMSMPHHGQPRATAGRVSTVCTGRVGYQPQPPAPEMHEPATERVNLPDRQAPAAVSDVESEVVCEVSAPTPRGHRGTTRPATTGRQPALHVVLQVFRC
ncbi:MULTISPECIES: hypothetical protein [Actinoplanes]|uniref:hypothetical protein n=1 Tax=Actinoplanes TaxID=1865 RepID=UPI0005F2D9E8|nr:MULTISPECIES: hypothetical protein [Actinoplanes]GLY04076.1 hypothetical protein Acsp01_44550 [Actinoplanes sp. NBRC 101535]